MIFHVNCVEEISIEFEKFLLSRKQEEKKKPTIENKKTKNVLFGNGELDKIL